MKTQNLTTYFYSAIHESIFALDQVKDIIEYYGNPSECTIENYFAAQIRDGKLYDSVQEFSEDTYLCDVDEYESEFEDQRQAAFNDWLESEVDSIDEDDLIDVTNQVEIIPKTDSVETDIEGEYEDVLLYNSIRFKGKESDMSDSEFATNGDSLFTKIYSLMGECSCGQNVRKAAILAGAKYIYVETGESNSDYTLHFWKDHGKTQEDLDAILEEVKHFDYYELKEKFTLIAECGKEDHKHYFFKYDNEVFIEYHDRADTTISTLSISELVDYYSNN